MARIVAEKTSADGLSWYYVICERCGEYLGALYAGMWTREQADDYPCHVCEPRAVGAITLDPDPADAVDFTPGEDFALYVCDPMYQVEADVRRRARIAALELPAGR